MLKYRKIMIFYHRHQIPQDFFGAVKTKYNIRKNLLRKTNQSEKKTNPSSSNEKTASTISSDEKTASTTTNATAVALVEKPAPTDSEEKPAAAAADASLEGKNTASTVEKGETATTSSNEKTQVLSLSEKNDVTTTSMDGKPAAAASLVEKEDKEMLQATNSPSKDELMQPDISTGNDCVSNRTPTDQQISQTQKPTKKRKAQSDEKKKRVKRQKKNENSEKTEMLYNSLLNKMKWKKELFEMLKNENNNKVLNQFHDYETLMDDYE